MRIWNPCPMHEAAGYVGHKTSRQGTIAFDIAHMLSAIVRYEETRDRALAWRIAGVNCVDSPAAIQRGRGGDHEPARSGVVEVMQDANPQHEIERLERRNFSLLEQPAMEGAATGESPLRSGNVLGTHVVADVGEVRWQSAEDFRR